MLTDSLLKARLLELHAMRGLVTEAREAKAELQTAVDDFTRAAGKLLEAGVHRDAAWEAVAIVRDAAIPIDHAHNQTLDEAGEYFDWLDLTEADALLASLKTQEVK